MSMNEEMRRLMEATSVKNNKTTKKKLTENKKSRSNDFSTFKSLNESCGCKSYDCVTCYPKDKLDEGVLGMANIGRSSTSETFVGRAGDAGNTLSNTGMGGYTGMVSASKDYDSESEDEYDLEKDPAMKSAYDDYVGGGPQTMYVAVDSEGRPQDFSDDEEYLQSYADDPSYEVKRANVTVELLEKEIRKNKKDKLMDERDSMRNLMDTINEAQEGKVEKEKLDETVLGMSDIGSTFVSATSESKFTEDEHEDDDVEVLDREDDDYLELDPPDDYEEHDPDTQVDVPDAPGVKDLDFDTEDTSELIAAIDQMQQMGMSLSDRHYDVTRLEDMPRSAVERIHNAVVIGDADEDEEDFE